MEVFFFLQYQRIRKEGREKRHFVTFLKGLLAIFTQIYQLASNQNRKVNGVGTLSSNVKICCYIQCLETQIRSLAPYGTFPGGNHGRESKNKFAQWHFVVNSAKLSPLAQWKLYPQIHVSWSYYWNPHWSSQVEVPIMPSLIRYFWSISFMTGEDNVRNFLRAIISAIMWQCCELGVMKPFTIGNWPQILINSSRSCSVLATYWNLDFLWVIVLWSQSLKCYSFFKNEICWYKLRLCFLLLLVLNMCGIPEDVWM